MRLLAILCAVFLYTLPANANWNDHTFNSDIDYYKDTYLELNPDAVLTDWQWFPGSGETDGDYTNDQFCFPFENNGNPYIIIGTNSPSTCNGWTSQTRYQGAEILSFFDLNLIAEPSIEYITGETYTTEDLLGDTSQYWSGCFNIVTSGQSWAGTSGGQCPNINDGVGGQINYGYIQQTLTNIAAINEALKGAGLETTGYTYSWLVKNADANFESENNPNSVDPFTVTLRIVDNNNNVVYEKTYDYSYHIDNWQTFSGSEEFNSPFDLDELSEIQLSITGQDIGGWAGYYGPEFRSPDVRLNYRVKEEDTTVEDLMFAQMCDLDPLSDMNCPRYNDAMLAQITGDITVEDVAAVEDPFIEDVTVIEEIAEVVEEPVVEMEVAAEEVASESSNPTTESQSKSGGLNANQLLALEIAGSTTAAAEQSASDTAQASAGVGLSENGGISSELTSDGLEADAQGGSIDFALGGDSQLGGVDASLENSTTGSMAQFDMGQTENTGSDSGQDGSSNDDMMSEIETALDIDINTNTETGSNEIGEIDSIEIFEFDVANIRNDIVTDIVNNITNNLIMQANMVAEEIAEESSEESIEEQNAREDELVAQALSGSDDEDAQAALLGFNPNFRAYQQPQIADAQFYQPKEIYEGQTNYDNPSARLFNGASDSIHRQMVRQQYERN